MDTPNDPIHAALSGPFAAALTTLEQSWATNMTRADRAGAEIAASAYKAVLLEVQQAVGYVRRITKSNPDIEARGVMAIVMAYLEVWRDTANARAMVADNVAVRERLAESAAVYTHCLYDLAYARLQPAHTVELGGGNIDAQVHMIALEDAARNMRATHSD